MNKIFGLVVLAVVIFSRCFVFAAEGVKADKLLDLSESIVGYDIKTVEGEDLILMADYTSSRPNPELENLNITCQGGMKDGTKSFTIQTKENIPINIEYTFSGGDISGMKISTKPSNPASDGEYSQI